MSKEDVKLHSKRVEKIENTLEMSKEDVKLHSKWVEKIENTVSQHPFRAQFFADNDPIVLAHH